MKLSTGLAAAIAAFGLASRLGAQGPPASAAPDRGEGGPLPALAAADVPKDIAWGPGREVQAGLRLSWRYGKPDQHTGLYVFAIYLRNVGKHTLTITCPSFSGLSVPADRVSYTTLIQTDRIHCAPHIRTSGGAAVDFSYKPSRDELRYSLGPGQSAMVSHWMLRTMATAAKKPDTQKYTQVAFVDPGKYRLTCDVTPAWGLDEGVRRKLRTGEVGFEVTAEDVGEPAAEVATDTRWGEPVEGVRAGLRVVGGSTQVHVGDRVALELVLRNTTDHAVDITWGNAQRYYGWSVRRLGRSPQEEVWEVAARVRRMLEESHEPVVVAGALSLHIDARSEVAVPMEVPSVLIAGKADPKDSAMTIVAKPGGTIRLRALPITAWARGEEWLDRLATGEVTLRVAGA